MPPGALLFETVDTIKADSIVGFKVTDKGSWALHSFTSLYLSLKYWLGLEVRYLQVFRVHMNTPQRTLTNWHVGQRWATWLSVNGFPCPRIDYFTPRTCSRPLE